VTQAIGTARAAGATGRVLVRADCAFGSGAVVSACRRAGVTTIRITIVAVYTLVIEPIWNSESTVARTPVPVCNTPVATVCT
jgi:hypothetical protein